jgi:hypothetical protein
MRKKQRKTDSKSYEVGYGRPPKKFRFKPGRSGNPTGTKRNVPSLTADLRALLEGALNTKIRHGEREQIVTNAAAGIQQLVAQFASGDRHARRDVVALAEKLGVDLTTGRSGTIGNVVTAALAAEDEAIIADFLRRHGVEPQQAATADSTAVESPGGSQENSP